MEAAAADVVAAGPAVGQAPPDLDPAGLAVDEPDLAHAREALVVPQLAVEILGPRRGREDLDEEERVVDGVGVRPRVTARSASQQTSSEIRTGTTASARQGDR